MESSTKATNGEFQRTHLLNPDDHKKIPWWLEDISCLLHLAVFGILGVGSFLMGWLGIVFKENISHISNLLAIGLTTGFLGSLTTFSGWNQKMLELAADGRWVVSIAGYIIGMWLVYFCIGFGVWTARGFLGLLSRLGMSNSVGWKVDSYKRHVVVLLVLVLMLASLLAVSGELMKTQLEADKTSAQLWLACMVGPLGVWARWFLARLNGRGLGRKESMKWVPFGTLLANVIAASLNAALATTKKVVNTKRYEIVVDGIQLGFIGNLSTVPLSPRSMLWFTVNAHGEQPSMSHSLLFRRLP